MWNLKLGFVWFWDKTLQERIQEKEWTNWEANEGNCFRSPFAPLWIRNSCFWGDIWRVSSLSLGWTFSWQFFFLFEMGKSCSWWIHSKSILTDSLSILLLSSLTFSIELFVPQAYQVLSIRSTSVSQDTELVSENETKRAFWIRFMFLQSKNFFISSYDPSRFSHPFAFSTFFLPSSSFSSHCYLFFFSNESPSGSSRLLNVMFDLLKWGKDSANRTWKILVTENLEDFFLYIILMDT